MEQHTIYRDDLWWDEEIMPALQGFLKVFARIAADETQLDLYLIAHKNQRHESYLKRLDFPYYVQDGISHDNIWSTTPLTTQQLTQVMDDKLGPRRKYAYFVNPGPLASIPGV
ncbi:MAG: hypothetical protein FRX49_12090 [Trebouxia sp. A1-2]|nr:MAG: hypothetical protein FRX49_12090 [Trebouxia sp. A1-2]